MQVVVEGKSWFGVLGQGEVARRGKEEWARLTAAVGNEVAACGGGGWRRLGSGR